MDKYADIAAKAKKAQEIDQMIKHLTQEGIGKDKAYRGEDMKFMGCYCDTTQHDALNSAWEEMEAVRRAYVALLQKLHDNALNHVVCLAKGSNYDCFSEGQS